jgi:hypothetical protein
MPEQAEQPPPLPTLIYDRLVEEVGDPTAPLAPPKPVTVPGPDGDPAVGAP